MATQLDLFADTADAASPTAALVCAFGVPWQAHGDGSGCAACDAETVRLVALHRSDLLTARKSLKPATTSRRQR